MTELLLQSPLDGKQRRFAETVQSSAHGLITIVNDILDFSRVEAGKLELAPVATSLDAVLEEVAELPNSSAVAKGVELICEKSIAACPTRPSATRTAYAKYCAISWAMP